MQNKNLKKCFRFMFLFYSEVCEKEIHGHIVEQVNMATVA